jgi:UDP-2,3-diacylglucosamine pyrophosphatase LpxH
MSDSKKRIFISDIHMGDEKSMTSRQPWGWFNNNIPLLTEFLDELWKGTDVEELVILGDLFDQWMIPADIEPLTSFYPMCTNQLNKPVIDKLKSLSMSYDIKLTYLPGNHDMAMDREGTSKMKAFLEDTFQGINFICERDSLGKYEYKPAKLVAEHGNRYCLFNAPGKWTDLGGRVRDSFLPLGYFISRMVAYKMSKTGNGQHLCDIFSKFIENPDHADFIERMLDAIAGDCSLKGGEIQLKDLPGYGGTMKVGDIGKLFGDLKSKWGKVPDAEKVGPDSSVENDMGNLNVAADKTFFYPGSETKVVIFGHTHVPAMWKGDCDIDAKSDNARDPNQTPCPVIYANSGTWVDQAGYHGTYVETEESQGRCWVRVKEYPSKKVIADFEGFVEI